VNLLDSLLDAIARLEGDALVMHVGEKPYVVTTTASMAAYRGPLAWGQVELSSRVLTLEAVLGMLGQLLPPEQREALEEFGAIEYAIPGSGERADRFIIVAARGGDDVWLEVRRRPKAAPQATVVGQPMPIEDAPAQTDAAIDVALVSEQSPTAVSGLHEIVADDALASIMTVVDETDESDEESVRMIGDEPEPADFPDDEEAIEISLDAVANPSQSPAPPAPPTLEVGHDELQSTLTHDDVDALLAGAAAALLTKAQPAAPTIQHAIVVPDVVHEEISPVSAAPVAESAAAPDGVEERGESAAEQIAAAASHEPALAQSEARPQRDAEPRVIAHEPEGPSRPAVVVPISRGTFKSDAPIEIRPGAGTPLERILRLAAQRGAGTVYVVAQSAPMIRVDGEIGVLDGEPVLTAATIERLLMDLGPARGRELAPATGGEWMADVPEVGRVRWMTFHDHRGPGVIFRLLPPQALSTDQLGLTAEVQALCAQPDGLVLVTGARGSGKSTLLSAFVDLINRTRSDHVITLETQIGFVHEIRRSFVSQRELRGDAEAAVAAVRSAVCEDPDVLVIEDVRTPEIAAVVLEAAESGRLVFASLPAASTVAAVERLIEMFPAERRTQLQAALAGALRGIVSQLLLRKVKGGRTAARELLLNTPAVASLILDGKTFQLPMALDTGRRWGMVPMADSLAALVRDGTVHTSEAYRKAPNRAALLSALKRDGVDTSFAERLA
jgi:twitching motility protein PilT